MIMPTNTLFIGIDVSLKTNQTCAINFNSDVFFNQSFDNTPSGTEYLIRRILETLKTHNELNKVIVCMEATNVYHIHASVTLANDTRLMAYGVKVYCENAKRITAYKETFLDREKTDPEDAFLCADYVRIGKCNKCKPVLGYQKIALQRLTRQRKHIAEQLAKEKNYISSNLFLKFSALKVNPDDNPFSNTYSKSSSFMLTDYLSVEDIVNADINILVAQLVEKSNNRFNDPEFVAKELKKMARDSYRLDKVSSESVSIAIASSFRMIQFYKNEMKLLEKEILRIMKSFDHTYYTSLISIPGIGPIFAAGIIAEIDNINNFSTHSKLASYCGLRWKRNDSGTKYSDHKKQPNACNKYLRYYIVEGTNSVIANLDEYKTFFYSKKKEVKINAHKRALVLTSRKFVRLIFVMLRKNKLFDKHYLTQQS